MGSANLRGCHEVQNIGAVSSYQRRYLYTTALAIVENDVLDAVTGEDVKPIVKEVKPKAILIGQNSEVFSKERPQGRTAEQLLLISLLNGLKYQLPRLS